MSDLVWMRQLHEELHPPKNKNGLRIKLDASRRLKKKEWARVQKAIVENRLVCEMGCTNMFGGVGIWIYDHPPAPGINEVEHVLTLTQEHLPGKTGKKAKEPSLGCCLREAWEVFSEFTHGDQNREWLKQYGLREPRDPSHYDY